MGFTLNLQKNSPIPQKTRKGEDSEYAKAMLSMPIGEECCHVFVENVPDQLDEKGKPVLTEEAKKLKYTANKLQKEGRARFSFRKGQGKELSKMWRMPLEDSKEVASPSDNAMPPDQPVNTEPIGE